MRETNKVLPDIEIDLPREWKWFSKTKLPLGLGPKTHEGALQISSPGSSIHWRDVEDLVPSMTQFVAGARLGTLIRTDGGQIPYGRFLQAECMSKRDGDVCAWFVVPPTHDPLLVTWIAESPSDEGKVARNLVASLRPGPFSSAVAVAVSVAQEEIRKTGEVTPGVFLTCQKSREIVSLLLPPFDDDQVLAHAIRHERARHGANVVVRIGLAEIRFPNQPNERVAFVYAESATRRKRFILPLSERGAGVHEVSAEAQPVSDFFSPADPRIGAALDASRKG